MEAVTITNTMDDEGNYLDPIYYMPIPTKEKDIVRIVSDNTVTLFDISSIYRYCMENDCMVNPLTRQYIGKENEKKLQRYGKRTRITIKLGDETIYSHGFSTYGDILLDIFSTTNLKDCLIKDLFVGKKSIYTYDLDNEVKTNRYRLIQCSIRDFSSDKIKSKRIDKLKVFLEKRKGIARVDSLLLELNGGNRWDTIDIDANSIPIAARIISNAIINAFMVDTSSSSSSEDIYTNASSQAESTSSSSGHLSLIDIMNNHDIDHNIEMFSHRVNYQTMLGTLRRYLCVKYDPRKCLQRVYDLDINYAIFRDLASCNSNNNEYLNREFYHKLIYIDHELNDTELRTLLRLIVLYNKVYNPIDINMDINAHSISNINIRQVILAFLRDVL